MPVLAGGLSGLGTNPDGSPVIADYQYMFGVTGIVLNGPMTGDFIDVNTVTGLDDPDLDANITDLDSRDGADIDIRYFKHRTITIGATLYAIATGDVESNLNLLKANYSPTNVSFPFYFKHPSRTQQFCMCKASGVKYNIDNARNNKTQVLQITLQAEDPLLYDCVIVSGTTTLPSIISTGRVYPKIFPYTYGALQAGGSISAINGGSRRSWPVFTVTNAIQGLQISNGATGQTWSMSGATANGDVMIIDMQNNMLSVNGVDKTILVNDGVDWIYMNPGTNLINYTAVAADSSTTIGISFRAAN